MEPGRADVTRATMPADRYRIERELGAGGMAIVYLVHDVRHDRKVALKVLRSELGSAIGAQRFLREVRITAGLTHPHILPRDWHDPARPLGRLRDMETNR